MVENNWKLKRISEILGIPNLDRKYLPPHVVITLKERIAEVENIGALILFGSMVKGEGSPKSDIDIMVVPLKSKNVADTKKATMAILKDIEKEYKLDISFSLSIYNGKEDSYFLWELAKDGVVIYCKPEMVIQNLQNVKPFALISYSYSGLENNTKKRIQRFLFSSKNGLAINKDNKMQYIAPGVLLLSIAQTKKITRFFDSLRVQYSLIKIWK